MAISTYTDWEVAEAQKAQLISGLDQRFPGTHRTPIQVRKYITGMVGKRLTDQVKAGIWLKPLGSEPGTTFSCVQDVRHPTLLVMVQPSTTGDSDGAPRYDNYRQLVRDLFHNRRATGLNCEMYSHVVPEDYEVDERLQRAMDVQIFLITTVIRESRS